MYDDVCMYGYVFMCVYACFAHGLAWVFNIHMSV
jgi:hypothetical protein